MTLVPASMESSFAELGMDGSMEALGRLLDAQRQLFHDQVDQLQRLVVTQCKLTGVNPLAQEMAAGALSIKIGKKPRDLLNPKAIKYMQSVFAIKDTFGKKETREISALCGITVTQVRDFFAGQRSRVRKLVRLAREKAAKSDVSKADSDQCSIIPEASPVIANDAPKGVGDMKNIMEAMPVPPSCENLPVIQCGQTIPTGSNDLKLAEVVVPSLSLNEETIPDIDAVDKKFLGNIFSLMRKEETFSGQIKLMEWILQICNSAVLLWFSTKGGIGILANWLSEAAIEEQTTVLCVILKVFCHLPLHKAPPGEMSAILQTVNKLRFYRTPDISNRARVLLSRWSKMIVRNQPMKIPSASISSNSAHKAMIRQQRISEILKDEFWQSKIGNPEELAFTDSTGNDRKLESKPVLKLIASASDGSNRKQGQNITPIKVRQRRKLLLVDPLDKRAEGRTAHGGRAAPSNHSRPISADDIQKAKLRAIFMQGKYGKVDASSTETPAKRIEECKELPSAQPSKILPVQGLVVREEEEKQKAEVIPDGSVTSACTKSLEVCQDELLGRLKSCEFQWHAPPVLKIDVTWRVGEGESSKEMEVQTQRIRREKETLYASPSDVPPNPKEPWDSEMDFDDSLTPEIPIEQLPDADVAEDSPDPPPVDDQPNPENPTEQAATLPATAPDLELLAVLLKNPELVFALTSGQGKNLAADERVALLDMIKQAGAGGETSRPKPNDPEPTSLPSPTPPSDVERVIAWRSALPTTQFPHQVSISAAPFPTQNSTQAMAVLTASLVSSTANPSPHSVPISTFPTQRQTLLTHQVLPQKHYTNTCPTIQQSLNHTSVSSNHLAVSIAPVAAPRAAIFHHDSYGRAPSPTQTTIAEASLQRREVMIESLTRRPNGLEFPPLSHRFAAVDTSYENSIYGDAYAMHRDRSTGREETLGRSRQSDSWSPDRNSVGHGEFRRSYDRSYTEPRREQRYESSRQRSSGHRDNYRTVGGGRWRERDGDRRR